MPQRPSNFRQSDVERAVKGARRGGLTVRAIEIAPDGTIRIVGADHFEHANDTPFDKWKAGNNVY